jgi:predicted nucleic acid-binding protein
MSKKPRSYVDTNVISAYVAHPPLSSIAVGQWAHTQSLMETANSRGIRLVASDLIRTECAEGDAGAARKRKIALRAVTIFRETEPMRRTAAELLSAHPDKTLIKKLQADARHYAAAVACKAEYIITWDERDFTLLEGMAIGLGWKALPRVVIPTEAAILLGTAVLHNPVKRTYWERINDPNTPWVRKIVRETKKLQAAALLKEERS